MTARERIIFRRALSIWGAQAQTAVAMEELGELTAALSRFVFRERGSLADVASEIADVRICLDQMEEALGGDEFRAMVGLERRAKLDRLEVMLGGSLARATHSTVGQAGTGGATGRA